MVDNTDTTVENTAAVDAPKADATPTEEPKTKKEPKPNPNEVARNAIDAQLKAIKGKTGEVIRQTIADAMEIVKVSQVWGLTELTGKPAATSHETYFNNLKHNVPAQVFWAAANAGLLAAEGTYPKQALPGMLNSAKSRETGAMTMSTIVAVTGGKDKGNSRLPLRAIRCGSPRQNAVSADQQVRILVDMLIFLLDANAPKNRCYFSKVAADNGGPAYVEGKTYEDLAAANAKTAAEAAKARSDEKEAKRKAAAKKAREAKKEKDA